MGRKRIDHSSTPEGGVTLGDVLRARGFTAPEPPNEPSDEVLRDAPPEGMSACEPSPPAGAPLLAGCPKVVVRLERKGRGGKAVTLVQPLPPLDAAAGDELARRLRRALGCGAALDGDDLVVQGDQRDRLRALLEAEGARRVVRG